jgi:hypothetical protein
MFYQNKYLKYKEKYLNLKNQLAGASKAAKAAKAKITTYIIPPSLLPYIKSVRDKINLKVNPDIDNPIYSVRYPLNKITIEPLNKEPILPEQLNKEIIDYLKDAEKNVDKDLTILYSQTAKLPFIINEKKLIVNKSCDNTVFRGKRYDTGDSNLHTNAFVDDINDTNKFIQVRDCTLEFSNELDIKINRIFNPRNESGNLLDEEQKLAFVPDDIYRWETEGETSSATASGGGASGDGASVKTLRKCIKCDIIQEYNNWFVNTSEHIFKYNQCKKCRHSSYNRILSQTEITKLSALKLSPDQFDRFKKEIEYMIMKITNPRKFGPDILHSLIPEEPNIDDYGQIYDFEWDMAINDRISLIPPVELLPESINNGNIFQERIQADIRYNYPLYITNGEGIATKCRKRNGELIWKEGKVYIKESNGNDTLGTVDKLNEFFHIFLIKDNIKDSNDKCTYNMYNHVDGPFLKINLEYINTYNPELYKKIIKREKIIEKAMENADDKYKDNDDFSDLSDHDFYFTSIDLFNKSRLNVGTFNIFTGLNKEVSLRKYKEVPYDFNSSDTTIISNKEDINIDENSFCFPIPEMYKHIEFLVKKINKLMTTYQLDVLLIQESSLYFHEAWTSFNNTDYGNVVCEQTKKSMLGGPGIIWRKSTIDATSFKGYKDTMGKPTCISLDCQIIKNASNIIPCTIASIHGNPNHIIYSEGNAYNYFLNPQKNVIFGGDFNLRLYNHYNRTYNSWTNFKDNEKPFEDLKSTEKYYHFLRNKLIEADLEISESDIVQVVETQRPMYKQIDFILHNFRKPRGEPIKDIASSSTESGGGNQLYSKSSPKKTDECKFFKENGWCGRGKECKYLHPREYARICDFFMKNGWCGRSDCKYLHPPEYAKAMKEGGGSNNSDGWMSGKRK